MLARELSPLLQWRARCRVARVIRARLIVIAQDIELCAAIAGIGDLEQRIVRQLALNGQMVALQITRPRITGSE
jgi:hypothetical protein